MALGVQSRSSEIPEGAPRRSANDAVSDKGEAFARSVADSTLGSVAQGSLGQSPATGDWVDAAREAASSETPFRVAPRARLRVSDRGSATGASAISWACLAT